MIILVHLSFLVACLFSALVAVANYRLKSVKCCGKNVLSLIAEANYTFIVSVIWQRLAKNTYLKSIFAFSVANRPTLSGSFVSNYFLISSMCNRILERCIE